MEFITEVRKRNNGNIPQNTFFNIIEKDTKMKNNTGDAETAYPEYPAPEKSPGICWYCAISGDQYEEAAGQVGEEKTGDRTL